MVIKEAVRPRRARAEGDKALRRRQILDAAQRLLLRRDYRDIRMQEVAAEAGLAKGTSYLYFRSKEALFLALCLDAIADWLQALAALAARHRGDGAALATALAADLADREVLRRLLALLHGVLEQNVGAEEALAFKQALKAHSQKAAGMLSQALGATPATGLRWLLDIHAVVVGVQQMARPAPCIAELHRQPAYAMFRIDLQRSLARLLRAVLTTEED